MHMMASSTVSVLPWMTRSMFAVIASNKPANPRGAISAAGPPGAALKDWSGVPFASTSIVTRLKGRCKHVGGVVGATFVVDEFRAVPVSVEGDSHVLAVAIEPSRLAAGLVDSSGNVLLRDRITTPSRDVWRALEQLIRRVIAAAPEGLPSPRSVGVSCTGPVDVRAGTVSPPLVPAWSNFPLREHLERLTGRSVELDTAGGALTEAARWLGEAAGVPSYLTIQIDSTVESGCVIDGIRLAGSLGNAGALAHLNVEPDGKACRCVSRSSKCHQKKNDRSGTVKR